MAAGLDQRTTASQVPCQHWLPLCLLQITNAPRSGGKHITELHQYILEIVRRINEKYGSSTHQPVSSARAAPATKPPANAAYMLNWQAARISLLAAMRYLM
jgi:hypothetical protein